MVIAWTTSGKDSPCTRLDGTSQVNYLLLWQWQDGNREDSTN
jgi:hypothetical protein